MNIADLLPPSISIDTAIEVLTAVANLVVLFALYQAFAPAAFVNARARSHDKRRRELRSELLAPIKPEKSRKSVSQMRGLLERLKLHRGNEARKASELLAKAGFRASDSLTVFQFSRLAAPIGCGVTGFLLAPALAPQLPMIGRLFVGIAAIGLGAFAPSVYVRNAIQKRRKKVQLALPDALDLFVICAEAGLSLDAAMSRVAREIGPSGPELADELGLTAVELGFLPNRRDALANFGRRVDTSSIRAIVTTLTQTERYGTPLAQALRVLAAEFRNDRLMKAEEKAARLPATLTVPMILFILPPLFVVLIGPAIIQVLASLHK
jgi:tight adherence protein C